MQLPQPINWNYHERLENAEGVISSWIKKSRLSKKGQMNLERSLDQLKQQPKQNWSRPTASSLGNSIYVIRFKDENGTQHRVFGHFFDEHHSFVITLNGYEKDNAYHPHDYKEIVQGHKTVCDKDFSGTTTPFDDGCALCKQQDNPDSPDIPALEKEKMARSRVQGGLYGSRD